MARLEEKLASSLYSPLGTLMLLAALGPIALYALNILQWPDAIAVPIAYGISVLGVLPLICIPFLARSFFLDTRARLGLFALTTSVLLILSFNLIAAAEWVGAASSAAWTFFRRELLTQALLGALCTMFACGMRYSREDTGEGLARGSWLALFLIALGLVLGLTLESTSNGLVDLVSFGLSTIAFALNASLLLRVAILQKSLIVSSLAFGQMCLALSSGLIGVKLPSSDLGESLLLHSITQLLGFYSLAGCLVWKLHRQGTLHEESRPEVPEPQALLAQETAQRFREHFGPQMLELLAKSEEALMSAAPYVTPAQVHNLYELNQISWNLLQKFDELDHYLAYTDKSSYSPQYQRVSAREYTARLQKIAEKIAENYFVQVESFCPEELGEIEIDQVLFLQACLPLIRNAIRYTQNGRISLHLYPLMKSGRPHLRLDIRDWGRGFSQTAFQSFKAQVKVDQTRELQPSLTFGGIPLAFRVCEKLGVDLSLESLYGTGSTWSLTWSDKLIQERYQRQLTPALSHRSALIFTQSPGFQDAIETPLSQVGLDIFSSKHLSSSLRLMIEKQPSLVFVEIDAKTNTFDFLETLQVYDQQWQVVGVIDSSQPKLRERARQAGASQVIDSELIAEQLPALLQGRLGNGRG